MQQPPPVATLLRQLQTFPQWLSRQLATPGIDWHCAPAEGEWCLTEVMCHLRDVEREVHQPRFQAVLARDGAFLSGAVADEWVEERAYHLQDGPTALHMFLAARTDTISLLPESVSDHWQRHGQHAFFGPTSLHELLNLAVQHDLAHREQVEALLQAQASGRGEEAF
ncbi:MAG: DinB family protein [Anaerolineae bacterium]|nr:DinB family protein [Anaerolineae bacterium]